MKDNKTSLIHLLTRLLNHISARRKTQILVLFILMFFASIAEIFSIGAVLPFLGVLTDPDKIFHHRLAKPLIDFLKINKSKDLLFPITIIFSLIMLTTGTVRLLLLWVQTRLSYSIGADLSINIYRRTLFQPYSVHVSRNSSEIINGISNKANGVIANIILPALTISSSLLMIVMMMATLFLINPTVAATAFIGFGSIYAIVILLTNKKLKEDGLRLSKESTQVVKALQEGLGGIRDVLIDGTQGTYCDIYRSADIPLRKAQANIFIIGNSPRFGIEALGMTLIAFLAYYLSITDEGLSTAVPILGALALGAQRLLPVLQQAYSSWTSIKGGQATLVDTLELLDQKLPEHIDQSLIKPMSFKKNLEIKNLSFQYNEQSILVLNDINILISKGERIGIIGTTGSGKSTLLDILMGLLTPTSGNFFIDGIKIDEKNFREWQLHIAHVPQSIFLADSTISQNIAFGIPPRLIDSEQVKIAAKKAQISKTIELLPEKYDTKVGERGVRLSGGQRQRIGIARALYKNADVIVFDEATSALDNETEINVMEAVESLDQNLTVLIVAHRLSTLKNCDRIIQLENGKIKSIMSYSEMISSKKYNQY